MAFTTPGLVAMLAAVDAAADSTARIAALATGLFDTVGQEICKNTAFTPNQQNKVVQLRAEFTANLNDVVAQTHPA